MGQFSMEITRPSGSLLGENQQYLISVLSERLGHQIDFELIWQRQRVSPEFQRLLYEWAVEVNRIFDQFAPGRQISEVAKRPEIWPKVRAGNYQQSFTDIPELGR